MFLHQVGSLDRIEIPGNHPILKWRLKATLMEEFRGLVPGALPENLFVIESVPGETFFHRLIMGRDRINVAKHLIRSMIWAVGHELRKLDGSFAQWVPLNGGLYFRAWKGMADLFPEHAILPMQTSFMPAGRVEISPGVWKAHVWDSHKGYFFAENIIIAEGAMASGSTGEAMVEYIALTARKEGKSLPKRLVLFVASGSYQGIVRTQAACKKYGLELFVVLSQAAFSVTEEEGPSSGKTFTDLCLLNEATVLSQEYLAKAQEEWQGKQGCAVGDVGESFVETREYARWTVHELFAPSMLGLEPGKVNDRYSNINVLGFLEDCPFLLRPLLSDNETVREQLRAVKKALIKHQKPVHWH